MFGQGYANGKQEYLSTIVSMYVLREDDGNGPLMSMLNHSIGCVALIKLPAMGQ